MRHPVLQNLHTAEVVLGVPTTPSLMLVKDVWVPVGSDVRNTSEFLLRSRKP